MNRFMKSDRPAAGFSARNPAGKSANTCSFAIIEF